MNTLSKTITSKFFNSPLGYEQLEIVWSSLVNSEAKHELTAAHHLAYAILRGKDWRKGFTVPTKDTDQPWGSDIALSTLLSAHRGPKILSIFGGILSPDVLYHIHELIPVAYLPLADAYKGEKVVA